MADCQTLPSPFPDSIGIEILEVSPERSVAALLLTERHCNAHGLAHGGAIFTLADRAAGAAANADGRKTVAMEMHIRFLRPARTGQRLVATATRRHQGRQTAFYQIEICDERNRLIACATGTGHVWE